MKKSDARILKKNSTTHNKKYVINNTTNVVENVGVIPITPTYMTPYPCDDPPEPEPDQPTPNPDRPPIYPVNPTPNPDRPPLYNELKFINGLKRVGNIINVNIHDDSQDYMTATPDGVSLKKLVNNLDNIKSVIEILATATLILRSDVNQMKDELQPLALEERLLEIMNEFHIADNGKMSLNIGKGLTTNDSNEIEVSLDKNSLDIDSEGAISDVWLGYETEQ